MGVSPKIIFAYIWYVSYLPTYISLERYNKNNRILPVPDLYIGIFSPLLGRVGTVSTVPTVIHTYNKDPFVCL